MPRVLMICAHAPSLDPRIRWEAEAALPRFDVTLLGFTREDAGDQAGTAIDSCASKFFGRKARSALVFLWRINGALNFPLDLCYCALLILLSPPLAFADAIAWLFAPVVRRRMADAAAHETAILSGAEAAGPLDALRARLSARVFYVFNALRQQFSPAAELFWNAIRSMPDKPDIVHCNDLDTLLVGVLAKRHYGCRLIYDAHEFYPRSDPAGRWIDIGFFSMLERLLIGQADAVVTVNPLLAEVMRQAYALPVVHAVANAEPWTMRREPLQSEMARLARGRVRFLFQGRFSPARGIAEMIMEWQAVDPDRAALFLRGPANIWRTQAINLTVGLGLLDRNVYFLDPVAENELVAAGAEADVGIIPYRPTIINDRLCCPNKLSQYLHAGLLVIANDLPYVKSILTEAEAGLFYNSAQRGTLSQAVQRVLDDPALLPRARKNALLFARRRFNWQIEGARLYALYEACAFATAPQPAAAQVMQ